jgi:cation-transporting ATPase 13A1
LHSCTLVLHIFVLFFSVYLQSMPREWVERDLTFCGFIAFECKIRADSPVVITALRESDHAVTMLTGDSPLTSIHVAQEVNICSGGKRQVAVLNTTSNQLPGGRAVENINSLQARWLVHQEDDSELVLPFASGLTGPGSVSEMNEKYDLVTTESDFVAIADALSGSSTRSAGAIADGTLDLDVLLSTSESNAVRSIWHDVGYFRVFARMSPQGKRYIIAVLQKVHYELYSPPLLLCV